MKSRDIVHSVSRDFAVLGSRSTTSITMVAEVPGSVDSGDAVEQIGSSGASCRGGLWWNAAVIRFNGFMRSFGVDDVLDGPPSWTTLLKRGLRRRCPRCDARDIWESRHHLAERCPVCGLRFIREPGFRLGAWFLNYMFVAILHLIAVMIWIVWRSNNPGGIVWPLVIATTTIITIPIFTYPWSLTLWSAVDLGMTPLELSEIVDAQDALGAPDADDAPPGGSDDSGRSGDDAADGDRDGPDAADGDGADGAAP